MNDDEILKAAKQIQAAKAKQRRAKIKQRILEASQNNPNFPTGKRYPVVLADVPWHYDFVYTTKSPSNHYPTMKFEDVLALPVKDIVTEDAALFMWSPNSHLVKCLQLIEAWGFDYVGNICWVKHQIGLGYWVRNQHELLLFAKRGKIMLPEPGDRPSSVIQAPRKRHSEKPVEAYEIIERMFPDLPRLELFARSAREGWTPWGNEVAPTPTSLPS